MNTKIFKTIDLIDGDAEKKRNEILDYFENTWQTHEKLYTQLRSDDVFYRRGDPLRHIILFYLGHTATFFINKLILAKILNQRINPEFESIFAIGVDEMSWDDLNDKHYNWPSVNDVRAYRNIARERITHTILNTPLIMPIDWNNPFWIIMMGIEHERIHLETSSVLIRQLPIEGLIKGNFGQRCLIDYEPPKNELCSIFGKTVHLGKPKNHSIYGWDNEYGNYSEIVEDFKTTKYLISNFEFLEFVNDGAYQESKFWTEEGWNWKTYKKAEMPLFWIKKNDQFRLRLMSEEIDMPWSWPVEVNYLEAKAFCNWKSNKEKTLYRLPTEAEWYTMSEQMNLKDQLEWDLAPGNINLEHFASPCPVSYFKQGDLYDVIGNVWQWTETPITGFPGFEVHPIYDDFSTPTFDGKHNLIKGGSWISTGNEATRHSRYAFRRHFYQHAGFRMVQSNQNLNIRTDEYETDIEVAESCESQWGDFFNNQICFQSNLSDLIVSHVQNKTIRKVLVLNVETGRLAFEMAQHYDKIDALDFSARFIRIPIQMQENGLARYLAKHEGKLNYYRELLISNTKFESVKHRIMFMQDNPNNIKPIYSFYDLIVVPNLLEKLIDPLHFLSEIHHRINEGGFLVIASNYDWPSEHYINNTAIGGYKKDGEPVANFDSLKDILSKHFVHFGEIVNLDSVLPKSLRLKICSTSEVTFWKKI